MKPIIELYLPQYDEVLRIFENGKIEKHHYSTMSVSIINRVPIKLIEERNLSFELAACMLEKNYPENVNTNAFCAAIRSMKI